MTDREIFEKETGIKWPSDKNYRCIEGEADYWKAYALWLEKRNEWVSVDERLPEKGNTHKFYDHNYSVRINFYSKSEGEILSGRYRFNVKEFVDDGDYCYELKEVTHWRPLPTPPDEERRERG